MFRRFTPALLAPASPATAADADADTQHNPIDRMPRANARRRVLRASFAAALGVAPYASRTFASTGVGADRSAGPAEIAPAPDHRRLAFSNTHTGERIDVVYQEGGRYLDDALAEIDHLLRDHRTGDVKPIDRALLDNLASLRGRLDTTEAFHVISGYRSPATNAKLAAASGGVARNSMHLQGRAIDIRVPGRSLELVRRAALAMNAGGVGYYPSSDFVHLDTGRVRRW
jgi:uncharacterized protein YcbK (DUF882 family)